MSDHEPAPAPLRGAETPAGDREVFERLAAEAPAAPAGDREGFERLAAELGPQLRLHCYRILGSLHDAEDALQEQPLWRIARHRSLYPEALRLPADIDLVLRPSFSGRMSAGLT